MTAIDLARLVQATWKIEADLARPATPRGFHDLMIRRTRANRDLRAAVDEILADRPAEVNMMGFDPE